MILRRKLKLFAGFLLSLGIAVSVSAPSFAASQEDAEKEGTVTWYVSMFPVEAAAIANEFMKEYPKIHIIYIPMRPSLPNDGTTSFKAIRSI